MHEEVSADILASKIHFIVLQLAINKSLNEKK